MKQKLFTLLTLLCFAVSGAWADYTSTSPKTITFDGSYGDKTFLDVAGTNSNASIESSSETCLAYNVYYLESLASKPSWFTASTKGSSSTSAAYTDAEKYGFLTTSGAKSSDVATNSKGYGYVTIYNKIDGNVLAFNVTGITGVSVLGKDNGTSDSKYFSIKIKEVASDGTLSDVGETSSTGNTSYHIVTYDGNATGNTALDGSKYYIVTVYALTKNSNYIAQISFTQASTCTSVAAPTDLTCSEQTSSSLTYTWTKAANAVGYIATLYPDAECAETPEASQVLGDVATVTFSGLAASRTYYCKVQSKGDGSTYCAEGNVTDAESGTTDAKAYTVTAESNNNEWGSAVADDGSLDATETTDVTATPNTGYEFVSWSVSGTGATLSSTTDNPTTLTMGTANATVTATFAAKTYTVTLDNQSATSAGTTSVTTTYNANTNLTSSITCPTKTDYVFMGYYTAANGEGKRLIDGSGAWIASVDGYTDASKNWKYDGDVTLYACWMKYANSVDFNVYAYSTLDREGAGTSTSDDFDFIEATYNIKNVLGGSTAIDHSANAPYIGLKFKRSGDYLKFAVEAGKQVTIVFGYVKTTKPKMSIDGGAEEPIDITLKSDNQVVYYAATAADRLFKVKASDSDAMVIKKIFITSSASTIKATVGANGYATFATPYALDLTDANRPAGLKAYKATRDGASLSFVALNQTVPAGTGLLLLGEENGPNYDIPVVEAAGAAATDNVMVGVTAATSMQSKADEYYYFVMKKAATAGDALAFAPLSTSSVTVPAGKAFVEVPNGDLTSSHELTFTFEEASGDVTGIAEVSSKKQSNGEYFNLNGQRVDASHKGIVIVNGKKFFNK